MMHGLAVVRDCIYIILQTLNLNKIMVNYDERTEEGEVNDGDGGGDCERELIFIS